MPATFEGSSFDKSRVTIVAVVAVINNNNNTLNTFISNMSYT